MRSSDKGGEAVESEWLRNERTELSRKSEAMFWGKCMRGELGYDPFVEASGMPSPARYFSVS